MFLKMYSWPPITPPPAPYFRDHWCNTIRKVAGLLLVVWFVSKKQRQDVDEEQEDTLAAGRWVVQPAPVPDRPAASTHVRTELGVRCRAGAEALSLPFFIHLLPPNAAWLSPSPHSPCFSSLSFSLSLWPSRYFHLRTFWPPLPTPPPPPPAPTHLPLLYFICTR